MDRGDPSIVFTAGEEISVGLNFSVGPLIFPVVFGSPYFSWHTPKVGGHEVVQLHRYGYIWDCIRFPVIVAGFGRFDIPFVTYILGRGVGDNIHVQIVLELIYTWVT